MQDNRILEALRTPNAILAVLVLALIAQTPHAADVFRLIVHGETWGATLHSYSFAIALELAVLLFVVQRRHHESYGFAGVSIAMNISYYYLHDVQLWSLAALPAMLVSVALPAAIARYSHVVAAVPSVQPEPVQDAPTNDAQPANNAQTETPAQIEDAQPDIAQRVAALRNEGLDDEWIATVELSDIPGTQIARVMHKSASTVTRWRNKVQNGHDKEVAR